MNEPLSPLVREVAECLGGGPGDGTQLSFVRPIQFLDGRLCAMAPEPQRDAMRELARFGWFLSAKKGSPIASRVLMQLLEQTAAKITAGSVRR